MKISLTQLHELEWSIRDVLGYLTDNSCGDPECCGGPYYTKEEYDDACGILAKFNLVVDNELE